MLTGLSSHGRGLPSTQGLGSIPATQKYWKDIQYGMFKETKIINENICKNIYPKSKYIQIALNIVTSVTQALPSEETTTNPSNHENDTDCFVLVFLHFGCAPKCPSQQDKSSWHIALSTQWVPSACYLLKQSKHFSSCLWHFWPWLFWPLECPSLPSVWYSWD